MAARVAVELGEAQLERVAVEEAGQRVDRRAAPVGAIGLDQRAGEGDGAEDQGDRGDHALAVAGGGAAGRADDGAEQEQGEDVGGADRRCRAARSGRQGDGREGEPHQRRAGGAARSRARRRRAAAGSGPRRRRSRSSGWALARMKRSATTKPAKPSAVGGDPPPAELGGERGQPEGEDREADRAVAAQAQLHVDQPIPAGGRPDLGRETRWRVAGALAITRIRSARRGDAGECCRRSPLGLQANVPGLGDDLQRFSVGR